MNKLIFVFLASIIIFSATAQHGTRTFEASAAEVTASDIVIDTNMIINLTLVGDSWSDEDKAQVTERLLHSYMPMISSEQRPAGVRYNYTFNFESESEDVSNELFNFIDSIAVKTSVPFPIEQWSLARQAQFEDEGLLYKLIDAFRVEDWLKDLQRGEGYTIYFLKPSRQQLGYLHTYGALTKDPDTNRDFVQEGLMGFGGKHRFYFVDLTAGPWYYPFIPVSENRVLSEYHTNIYDVEDDEQYYDLISNYVNDAITLLFTPSYLYAPVYKLNYKMQVFLIDMTSGRALYDVATTYLKPELIEEAFLKLIPYAQWESEITGESFDSLPRELQKAILNSVTFQRTALGDTALVKSSEFALELRKWTQTTLSEEELRIAEEEAETTVFVPIILFVFDTPAYVDMIPVVGSAIPDPEDKTKPCCAIVAVDKHSLLDYGTGLSTLAVHEMGHIIGLRHPHDGHSESKHEFNNWFFDWSYTPMTYASPGILGCGLPDERCGLVITEFGAFNLDTIDRGLVLSLMREAQFDLNNSTLQLQEKGYDKNSFPEGVASRLFNIGDDLQKSKELFAEMNYFNFTTYGDVENTGTVDDALDFALRASAHARSLLEEVKDLPKNMSTSALLGNVLDMSDLLFIDENNVTSSIHEVAEPILFESRVTSKVDHKVNFTVIFQVKDSNGYTVALEAHDYALSTDETIKPSSSFIFERSGEFDVKIFLWTELDNPVPLTPVTTTSITLVK
jgi:hypothetical protein